MKVKTIDLWFDHKPSQALDPFIFDEKTQTFDFDKVILCPNLVGHCKMINPKANGLEHKPSICPDFNGGIIFLKNGVPIRLYLCQSNQIIEDVYGHKFGADDILDAIHSEKTVGATGKTMAQLLKEQNIPVIIDESIKSKYVSENGYVSRNHVVLESADCMDILTSSTFIDEPSHWENISFDPDLRLYVGVTSKDFEIDIEHKGYLIGCKNNAAGLVDDVNGMKWYGIALQTGKPEEYGNMVKYAEEFSKKVGCVPSEKAKDRKHLERSLL